MKVKNGKKIWQKFTDGKVLEKKMLKKPNSDMFALTTRITVMKIRLGDPYGDK